MSDELAIVQVSTLEGIADAVREKRGLTEKIKVDQIEAEARNIQVGVNKLPYILASQNGYAEEFSIEAEDLSGVEKIKDYFFKGCGNLRSPNTGDVLEIGVQAFYGCIGIWNGTRLPSVVKIGDEAFMDCTHLQDIYAPNVTHIGSKAFYNNDYLGFTDSVEFPSATYVGDYAFSECKNMKTLRLPKAITIGKNACRYCSQLQHVDISEDCTDIGYLAFYTDASSGAGLTVSMRATTPPTIDAYAFDENTYGGLYIRVPQGCGDAYKTATNWSKFADRIEEWYFD